MDKRNKNFLIGLFVSGAITLVICMTLFLKPSAGDGKKALRVRFANISGVSVGTRVTFAGKPVGEVLRIQEINDARRQIESQEGKLFLYELLLRVDSSVDLYTTDEISIRTSGLMGEKSVAILPKQDATSKPNQQEIFFASTHDSMDHTVQQMAKTAKRMEETLEHLDGWFCKNSTHLSKTVEETNTLLHQLGKSFETVNTEGTLSTLHESVQQFNEIERSVRASLESDQLLYKIANLTESLDKTASLFHTQGVSILHNLDQITSQVAKGHSSIGKLLAKDDLYLQVNALLSKADTMMNDINHYGVLFQYSKGWQRSRTKRANILKSLESPKEFHQFFASEVDTVNTALGRLHELVDQAQNKEYLQENDAFKKEFLSLMRSIEALSSTIKVYNENLFSQE